MKSLVSTVLLSGLILVCSHRAFGADTKIDPSQFPLAVHISASAYAPIYNGFSGPFDEGSEIVTAAMNGKHYQLQGPTYSPKGDKHGNGLLNPGDYHARLSIDEHKTSYESIQQFDLLLPDGSWRVFRVIAQSE